MASEDWWITFMILFLSLWNLTAPVHIHSHYLKRIFQNVRRNRFGKTWKGVTDLIFRLTVLSQYFKCFTVNHMLKFHTASKQYYHCQIFCCYSLLVHSSISISSYDSFFLFTPEKGIRFVQEGQYSQAVSLFTEAIKCDPKDYR